MKTTIVKCLVPAALLGVMRTAVAAQAKPVQHHYPASINTRLHNQQERILQGQHSGQLTRHEEEQLKVRDARIRYQEAKMRASGEKFTPAEHRRLESELNHTSHAIYQQKHDGQHR